MLTHWGRATHICVGRLTTIGSDNGLSPGRRQAIIWTNAGILLIGPPGTNFSEILIEIYTFSFKKMRLKGSSAKWRLFRLGLNELSRLSMTSGIVHARFTKGWPERLDRVGLYIHVYGSLVWPRAVYSEVYFLLILIFTCWRASRIERFNFRKHSIYLRNYVMKNSSPKCITIKH